jgi:ribosome-associated heat shock protein Hsp15
MSTPGPISAAPAARVRLDKWLWAARFFKTRSAAADAIDGGKVDANGEHAKRSRLVVVGDVIMIRRPPFEHEIVVRGLSETRGAAKDAALLFEETPGSRAKRELLSYQLKNAPVLTFRGTGRPTKRDRRVINKIKQGW